MSAVTSREKVLAIVFAMVTTAILVELGFRAMGPTHSTFNNMQSEYPDNPRGYFDLLRNDSGREVYGIAMNTAVGVGGRAPDSGTNEGPSKILGLGDSQAQGQGVRYADTMYAKLGEQLTQAGRAMAVKNVAVKGYDLNEIVSRYAYEADEPGEYDWVVYAMVLDDFGLDPNLIQGQDGNQNGLSSRFDPWRARSATYNFFVHISEQWRLSQTTTEAYLASYRGENFKKQSEKLQHLASSVRTDGARFVIVLLPLLYDFEGYPFGEIHSTMVAWGKKNHVDIIDGFEVLNSYQASDLWVHAIDHHPNEVAHQALSMAIYQHILSTEKR